MPMSNHPTAQERLARRIQQAALKEKPTPWQQAVGVAQAVGMIAVAIAIVFCLAVFVGTIFGVIVGQARQVAQWWVW